MPLKARRFRSHVKTAVASALAKAHHRGLAGPRGTYRPLVIGYHRVVEDFEAEAKVEAKALHFPDAFDTHGLREIRSFAEFDDRFTARLHGFRDAADYWTQSSARPLLPRIGIPALLLNALDDPFLAPESFPEPEAQANAQFTLEMPRHGGHLGFIDARGSWLERRIVEFLGA